MGFVKQKPPPGGILQVISAPCAENPQVWVEAAVPTLLKAFSTIIRPNIKTDYRLALGQSWLHTARVAMEDALETPAANFDGATKMMFQFAELVDQASWYLFLADVGAEALINWSTQVWQMSGCTPATKPGAYSASSAYGGFYDNTGPWGSLDFEWQGVPDISPGAPSLVLAPGQSGTICVAAQFEDIAGDDAGADSQIVNLDTGFVHATGTSKPNPAGGFHDNMVFANIPANSSGYTFLKWEARGTGVTPDHEVFFKSGNAFVYQP